MEPKYPGLVERYVNLGDCYDRTGLGDVRKEIMEAMKGYKACYQRAYRCLDAAAEMGGSHFALLEFVRDNTPEQFAEDAARLIDLIQNGGYDG